MIDLSLSSHQMYEETSRVGQSDKTGRPQVAHRGMETPYEKTNKAKEPPPRFIYM